MRPLFSIYVGLLAVLCWQACLAADQAAPKQPTAKQPQAKTAPAKQTLKPAPSRQLSPKPTTPKPVVARSSAGKPVHVSSAKPVVRKAPPRPRTYAQLQPAQERYREIQQALADKGYFSGTPDGLWGASSVEALKRFQHDQNLPEDGKVDSLSLIALGLGPRRTVATSEPAKSTE